MDVESVARELYRLPPAHFTAARNARAKHVAAAGDRELADGIRKLAKASPAAWAVNRVLADEPELKGEVVRLGETLREAQEHPDRQTLTELSEKRKGLVRRATNLAIDGAERDGVGVSGAAQAEIEQTLFAAVADSGAAAAVFSGRLVRALQSTGFEQVDTSGAVGGPQAEPIVLAAGGAADARGGRIGPRSAESARGVGARSAGAGAGAGGGAAAEAEEEEAAAEAAAAEAEAARKRAHEEAVRVAEAARQTARDAARKADDLAGTLSGYDREAREVAAEIDDLESQLEARHDRQRELGAQQRKAEREHRDAVTTAGRAARDADAAAARAVDLSSAR
ncbi:hypothetical protein [Subtercola endophyticus]|uniref:hypothetical protein n=1 Tax=Subtercola endophyticus TaxID=2895559 RepID=UPI001E50C437|nr:hypothetical protein [Subtercola endophyticus]UFS59675.1 hypothetical protein LQ955_02425 [Subtercola endophyticus]